MYICIKMLGCCNKEQLHLKQNYTLKVQACTVVHKFSWQYIYLKFADLYHKPLQNLLRFKAQQTLYESTILI